MACSIDRERRATNDTWLAHLTRHQRRMRGSAADGCHDSCGDSEACDISRAGIGPNQNDRLATRSQTFSTLRIKGRASDRDSRGCTSPAPSGLWNIDQAFARERIEVQAIEPP